jgi:hypothetical protein
MYDVAYLREHAKHSIVIKPFLKSNVKSLT